MTRAILFYESTQLKNLRDELKVPGSMAVACGLDLEFLLAQEGISFVSARDLRPTPTLTRLIWAEDLSAALVNDASMSFFRHREVDLGRLYAVALQDTLARLSYWIDIVSALVARESPAEVVVLRSYETLGAADRVLERYRIEAPALAAKLVCNKNGIACRTEPSVDQAPVSFAFKRALFSAAIEVLNTMIRVLARPKPLRIVASEQWKNIGPLLPALPEVEVVLLDRTEALKIGWQGIVRNRMRFVHADRFVPRGSRTLAVRTAHDFAREWQRVRVQHRPLQEAVFNGLSVAPVLEQIFETLCTEGARRAIWEYEGIRAMLEALRPQVVIVRAGVSAQTHFALMCIAARALNIPSLEIQHGTLYLGPGSYAKHRASEFIAEYGPIVRSALRAAGYTDAQLFDVGSPRFDAFLRALPRVSPPASFSALCISPEVAPGLWTDTYDVYDYYAVLAQALAGLGTARIKLRPGPVYEAFCREALTRTFAPGTYEVAQYEPLAALLPQASVVISCYSTAMMEALMSGRPLVYAGIVPLHATYGAEYDAYAQAGALAMARSGAALRESLERLRQDSQYYGSLVDGARAFLAAHYLFDGKGIERLAHVIRSLITR